MTAMEEEDTTDAAAREHAGLTQTQVAERARTTQSVIARIEGCRGGIPSLPLLDRIARAIGIRIAVSLCRARITSADARPTTWRAPLRTAPRPRA
ncbi:MAG: helix-turn-helix transcriptional regulator [Planctomycetes bacterium]|nr:helix-turn-helix transcriptional regulator [Planctomycetota bacterium]